MVPLSAVIEDYWSKGGGIWWCGIKPESGINGSKVLERALSYWGQSYASLYQFLVVVSPTLKRIRKVLGRPLEVSNRVHCSWVVAESFMYEGYQHDKPLAMTTPGDVLKFSCLKEPLGIVPNF